MAIYIKISMTAENVSWKIISTSDPFTVVKVIAQHPERCQRLTRRL